MYDAYSIWTRIFCQAYHIATNAILVARKRDIPTERKEIKELGEQIQNILITRPVGRIEEPELFSGYYHDGIYLAYKMEKEFLKNKKSTKTKKIRGQGIRSLDRLAEILQKAESKRFDRFAQNVSDLFKIWGDYARYFRYQRACYGGAYCHGIPASIRQRMYAKVKQRFPWREF